MARKTEADVERTEEQNDQRPGIGHEGRGEGDGDASTAVAETKAKLKSSRPSNTIGILKRKPAFGVVAAGAIGLVAANVVGVGEVAIAMAAAYAAYRALTA